MSTTAAARARTRREKRRRLDPGERERQILEGAIRFFAEAGFEGNTRELARRLGIAQPLIFRYFGSKEALIERVYEEVYARRWNPEWEALVVDRSLPLRERLVRFYRAYARAIFHHEWVRIFVHAGLRGATDFNSRYLALVRERLLVPLVGELRREAGLPPLDVLPVTEPEVELAWMLHGGFFYVAIRHWVYGQPLPADLDGLIERDVAMFVTGAPPVLRELVAVRLARAPDADAPPGR